MSIRRKLLPTNSVFFCVLGCVLGSGNTWAECENPRDFSGKDKIVGGRTAHLEYWPGQAVFRDNGSGEKDTYFCGGSLISPDTVLTAAHCVDEFEQRNEGFYYRNGPVEIVLGTSALRTVGAENIRRVSDVVRHDLYKYPPWKSGNDIAIVRLSKPWNGPLSRLSLRNIADPQPDWVRPLMVAGFGLQTDQGKPIKYKGDGVFLAGSDRLLEVPVPMVPESECVRAYVGKKIGKEQICAGYEEGGRDSCNGDSGGPLVTYDRQSCPYQVGIVSWGDGCAKQNAYGVYTRVSAYADWIKERAPGVHEIAENAVYPVVSSRLRDRSKAGH